MSNVDDSVNNRLNQLLMRFDSDLLALSEQARAARWLQRSLAIFGVALLIVFAAIPFIQVTPSERPGLYIAAGGFLIVLIVAQTLIWRERLGPAGIVLSLGTLSGITFASATLSGIRDATVIGYFVLVVLANLFLPPRLADGLATLSLLAMVFLYFGEHLGLITAQFAPLPDMGDLLVRGLALLVCAVLLRVIVLKLTQSADIVRQTNAQLAEANARLADQEATLRVANDTLESRVRARTADLERTNEALQHEMKERRIAENALVQAQKFQSLGFLAAGVAHDVKNKLNVIGIYVELMRDEIDRGNLPNAERTHTVLNAVHRATELTEQITAYAGSQRGERTTVNLNDLIVENTTFFSTAFPSTVTLTHHLAANLPAIHADATQMQQIIMNLIINAVEAVDESTGRITLRTYETSVSAEQSHTWAYVTELPPDGNLVCLEVGDNGCGMDSETVQRIFDPLFTTKSSQSSGRGLGLVAVSRIVRDHRGGMGIITQPDVGSTFRIFLPPKPAFL